LKNRGSVTAITNSPENLPRKGKGLGLPDAKTLHFLSRKKLESLVGYSFQPCTASPRETLQPVPFAENTLVKYDIYKDGLKTL